MITQLEAGFGSRRSVARSLGITHTTLLRRLENPKTVKREHRLAAEALLLRIIKV
jgi:DNA invertase Pin-like site-specific DNA recombinase